MLRRFAVIPTLLVFSLAGLSAHEMGTSRVRVSFPTENRYQIDVVTDATALLEKMEAASGAQPWRGNGATDTEARIDALRDVFASRVAVTFDETPITPSMAVSVQPSTQAGGAPVAFITLTGERPPNARQLFWEFGWTFVAYEFAVQRDTTTPPVSVWLEGEQTSAPIALDDLTPHPSRSRLAGRYVGLGVTNVVRHGFDHVLFLFGVFLLSRTARSLLLQLTAFAVACSITLGLSLYGVMSVPPPLVEPMLAISIVYVALESLLLAADQPWRVALVFLFGLLHGLGFAGVLREIGLPTSGFLTALVGFNVGVELAQGAVIGLAFAAVGYWWHQKPWYDQRIIRPASASLALVGLLWTVQRLHFG